MLTDKIIKAVHEDIPNINSQLEQKLNKDGIVTMANMGQDVKEAMTGGSVAVVGINAVGTENIKDLSISQDKIINKGLYQNKSIEYPLIFNDNMIDVASNLYNLKECLLDIKIFNAVKNTDYSLTYITKNQTSFGDLILIEAKDRTTNEVRNLFSTKKVSYDIKDRYGVSTVTIDAENGDEIVEITFNYKGIPDNYIPQQGATSPFKTNIISPDKLIYSKSIDYKFNNYVYVGNTSSQIYVTAKMNANNSIRFDFEKLGANKLFALYNIYKNKNIFINPKHFSGGTKIAGTGSDWISPYYVKAVNNGDSGAKTYTGGSHSKDNTMVGEATAETVKTELYIDDKLITTNGEYKANKIDLYVTNKIMGYNTKTTNRYILQEIVHYSIVGSKINVSVEIKALEDIIVEEYYGLQAVNGIFDKVMFVGGQFSTPQNANSNISSGAKQDFECDTFILQNDSTEEKLIGKIDKFIGLGKREMIGVLNSCIFSKDYGKTYMRLIMDNTTQLKANNRYYWEGSYEIY